jgi:iron complex transport system substrate-binding protein
MRRLIITLIALGLLVSVFPGCAAEKQPPAYPRIIVDDLGRNVTIPEKPARIISLYPSFTETLFALGAGEQVVGVTKYCDYPPEASQKEQVGGVTTPDLEKVVALNPDVVLVDARLQQKLVNGLENFGLTVVALYPKNLEEIIENIRLIGKVTGHEPEAKKLTADIEKRVKFITDRTKELADSERPRVFYLVWYDPLKTMGPGSLVDELLQLAGGQNIAADAKEEVAAYSLEMVVQHNPQVIILAGGSMTSITIDDLKALEQWQVIDAVKQDRVYMIDAALIAGARPRIVDGLEMITKCLHPELTEEANEH